MARGTLYLPVMIAAAVAVACAVALSAVSQKAEATFPGKNGRIAYHGYYGIYTINSDGSGKTKVTRADDEPSYSPNGKRIAYSGAGKTGIDSDIYTIKVGGGDMFKVTNNTKDEVEPSYSPDGKRIAYTGFKVLETSDDEDFDSEIYTIKVGGGGKSQVTNTKYRAWGPSWGSRP